MASIIYKTLFEVQLLHEYYLTNCDGATAFNNTINKADFLQDRFGKSLASIGDSLLYEIPESVQNIFKNYHLHMVASYSGFSVFARGNKQYLADGTITYKPFVKLPDDCNILIQMSLKNNLLNTVTNSCINKPIPAAYYFTNEDVITAKTFPSLSSSITPFDVSYLYEQGESYTNDQNKVCLFYIGETGLLFYLLMEAVTQIQGMN